MSGESRSSWGGHIWCCVRAVQQEEHKLLCGWEFAALRRSRESSQSSRCASQRVSSWSNCPCESHRLEIILVIFNSICFSDQLRLLRPRLSVRGQRRTRKSCTRKPSLVVRRPTGDTVCPCESSNLHLSVCPLAGCQASVLHGLLRDLPRRHHRSGDSWQHESNAGRCHQGGAGQRLGGALPRHLRPGSR